MISTLVNYISTLFLTDLGDSEEKIWKILGLKIEIKVYKWVFSSNLSSNVTAGPTLLFLEMSFSPSFERIKKKMNPPKMRPPQINQSSRDIGMTAKAVTYI